MLAQRPCVNSGAIRVPDVGACVAARAQEIDELCDAWQPQPLVSAEDVKKVVQRKERVVTRQSGSRVTINGKVRVCACTHFHLVSTPSSPHCVAAAGASTAAQGLR